MTSIWYENIEDIMISLTDPSTWWATYDVPWISTTKIDGATSVYNVSADWIAWWSTDVTWASVDYNTVSRWSWNIYLPDWTTISITSGNTWNMSGVTYIYYNEETETVTTTTTAQDAVWKWKILLCVASPSESGKDAQFQAFWTNAQSTFITADNIAANTIAANDLVWNTIDWRTITWWTVTQWTYSTWDYIRLETVSNQPRISIGDNGTQVWYITWSANPWWWSAVWVYGDWAFAGMVGMYGKFKLPVWTNLYP